jgi:hypothetical protein
MCGATATRPSTEQNVPESSTQKLASGSQGALIVEKIRLGYRPNVSFSGVMEHSELATADGRRRGKLKCV